jgi:hypothetical protein
MQLITKNYTLNLQPLVSKLNPQDVANLTLRIYPALSIDLSPIQVTASCLGHQIDKPSEHQLKAITIAAQFLNCHPDRLGSVCAIRPTLLPSDFLYWEQQARQWQLEHDLNIAELADLYIKKWQDLIVTEMSSN